MCDSFIEVMGDAFKLSAILGWALGVWCFTLPKTPPKPGQKKFAPFQALAEIRKMPLLVLFLISFPMSCVHQFYFVRTSGFLATLQSSATASIDKFFANVFGVGGGGLMTIGQIAELAVLAFMPILAKKLSRKMLLTVGVLAYTFRFAVFAYLPFTAAVVPALALHGLCFGCFFFVAFMIVDEETSSDVRASAQGLFNLMILGFGPLVANVIGPTLMGETFKTATGVDFRSLFLVPFSMAVAAAVILLLFFHPPQKNPTTVNAGH